MATLAIAVVGGLGAQALGLPFGVGFAAGRLVTSLLFPPEGATIERGRLNDLRVTASTFGGGVAEVDGSARVGGNVIWASDIVEVRKEEEQGGKGGGGTTIVSFEYFGNFAVALAEGPVDAVRRIWADNKLIADLSDQNQGPRFKYGEQRTRIYLGTTTQQPDPLLEADEGAGNVPGYRNTVYVVFDRLPLKDFGNRLPQISAEIVVDASDTFPVTAHNVGTPFAPEYWQSSPDGLFLWFHQLPSHSGLRKINKITGEVVQDVDIADMADLQSAWDAAFGGTPANAQRFHGRMFFDPETGDVLIAAADGSVNWFALTLLDKDTLALKGFLKIGTGFAPYDGRVYFGDSPAPTVVWAERTGTLGDEMRVYRMDRGKIAFGDTTAALTQLEAYTLFGPIVDFAVDTASTRIWTLHGNTTPFLFMVDAGGKTVGPTDLTTLGLSNKKPVGCAYDKATDSLLVVVADDLTSDEVYKLNPSTFAVIASVSGNFTEEDDVAGIFAQQDEVDGEFVTHSATVGVMYWFDTRDLTFRSNNFSSTHGVGLQGALWDDELEAAISPDDPTFIKKLFLRRFTTASVPLSSIVSKYCGKVGLGASDIDVSELTDQVLGYVRDRPMPARRAIEPLQAPWFFDGVESDGKLKFPKRDRASVATVAAIEQGAHEAGGEKPPLLTLTRSQEVELPRAITVNYISQARDYQVASQQARRISEVTQSVNEVTVEVPIVLDADFAQNVAARGLGEAWAGRDKAEIAVPLRHLRLDAADVVTVEKTTGGATADIEVRLTDVDLGGSGVVRLKGVFARQAVFQTSLTGDDGGAPQFGIPFTVPTKAFYLNLPVLLPGLDNDGGFWLAAAPAVDLGPNATDWRGAVILRSADGEVFAEFAALLSPIAWGVTKTVLADQLRWTVWDDTSTVTVRMETATALSSKTDLEVLNGANAILVGSEIVQFATATLVAANTYRLSRLLRGRLGTEWATGSHAGGETVVVLSPSVMERVSQLSEVGQTFTYRAVTVNEDVTTGELTTFANAGTALKPFSPADVAGSRDGSDNLTVTWKRRTRFNGAWRDLVDVPLNEATKEYEADFRANAGGPVLRTKTGLTSESVTYTATEQTADGITPGDPVHATVYQISADVGRGTGRAATV